MHPINQNPFIQKPFRENSEAGTELDLINGPLTQLPSETLTHVFSFLGEGDLQAVRLVNRQFKQVIDQDVELTKKTHETAHKVLEAQKMTHPLERVEALIEIGKADPQHNFEPAKRAVKELNLAAVQMELNTIIAQLESEAR